MGNFNNYVHLKLFTVNVQIFTGEDNLRQLRGEDFVMHSKSNLWVFTRVPPHVVFKLTRLCK